MSNPSQARQKISTAKQAPSTITRFRPKVVNPEPNEIPPPPPDQPPPAPFACQLMGSLAGSDHSSCERSFLFLAELRDHREVLERRGVAHRLLAGGDVPQQPPHDLAAAGLGKGVGEADLVGSRDGTDLLHDVLLELVL